jgi:tyrosyl-tRNA synthetase
MSLFKKTASIDTRPEKIEALLSRGVEDVFVMESLKKKLMSGKPLRIKFGIDPTGPTIHLGRAIPLRKLKAFQDLGHTIVLVIGDFTARIGDPSDKIEKRPMLTEAKIKEKIAASPVDPTKKGQFVGMMIKELGDSADGAVVKRIIDSLV